MKTFAAVAAAAEDYSKGMKKLSQRSEESCRRHQNKKLKGETQFIKVCCFSQRQHH